MTLKLPFRTYTNAIYDFQTMDGVIFSTNFKFVNKKESLETLKNLLIQAHIDVGMWQHVLGKKLFEIKDNIFNCKQKITFQYKIQIIIVKKDKVDCNNVQE